MRVAFHPSKTRTGGQLIVDALRAHGIDTVFCVPGESYLPVLDALYDARGEIAGVVCRHEHGASDMAEAYGKLTGRPGVCLVTRGPGACNAGIGVHTAFQDSTPMLLLIGQVERRFLGREAFQEVDFVRMFGALAKRAEQVERTDDLPTALARAFHTAVSGRPGPVALALPEDILGETADAADAGPWSPVHPALDEGLLERLHHALGDAERPLMLVGGGGWSEKARANIVAFAEANELPACCSFRRHDIFDNDHPCFVGELGIGVNPALVARAKAADLLLAVGARLGEATTQGYTLFEGGEGPRLVHVHADPGELGRVFKPALTIPSSVAEFAAALRALTPVGGACWRAWTAAARQDYLDDQMPPPSQEELDLGRVMTELRRKLPADAVITVDAGNFSGWPQRFLRFGGGRRLLGATNGAMGYGVPAAVAAKIAAPERTVVVACVGDGGFGMTGQELGTALQRGVAPIVLVFNNGMYGTIRMHQERAYPGRPIATALTNPDFVAIARAYGAHGEKVRRTEEFGPAFERARTCGRASVIELVVNPEVISARTTLSGLRSKEAR